MDLFQWLKWRKQSSRLSSGKKELPEIQFGDQGQAVRALQQILNSQEVKVDEVKVDGKFGSITEMLVKQFQKNQGLKCNGVVNDKTWECFIKVVIDNKAGTRKRTSNVQTGETGDFPVRQPKPYDVKSNYLLTIKQYIPTEIVGGYLAARSVLISQPPNIVVYWLIFTIFTIATPLYIKRVYKRHRSESIVIGTVAFFVWTLCIGGPFDNLEWYSQSMGTLLAITYTVIIPLLEHRS